QGTEAEVGEQAPGRHCQPRYQKVYYRLQEDLHVCGDSRAGARWSFSNEALTCSVRAHRVVPSPPPSRRGASEARVARVEDGVEHLARAELHHDQAVVLDVEVVRDAVDDAELQPRGLPLEFGSGHMGEADHGQKLAPGVLRDP